ncbi:MAG: HD domain-containing protein, partial [Ktedonobacteraceae bacterium]|nr:HD domain-containing protein [Ktedonobacteraceae bacterium]
MSSWLHTSVYRLRQVWQQLGFVTPLSAAERQEVARVLPDSAVTLFETMSAADQRHSLRVYRGLLARGCAEPDMLVAALLHDVGKAQGRVPFWTRPVIVIGKRLAPGRMPGAGRRETVGEVAGCRETVGEVAGCRET